MTRFEPTSGPAWYRWYVVFALGVLYAVSTMDRSLLTILQQPIKEELGLSDSQLGSLTGLAFAAFYATLAIPIARFADRSNRMLVTCAALTLWSVMTAGCGVAGGFITLLVFRMGVGVGEAGGYPPAASILSDYFPSGRRATALALFGLGAPIGSTVGLFTAGWLNELWGWRGAFFLAGGVGLVLAPILLFTVREPRRGASDVGTEASPNAQSASLLECAKVLWRLKTIRYLYLANMCHGFAVYANSSWAPPFYIRVFHMPTARVAVWLGLLSILGALGTFLGGFLADRLGKRDPRWRIWMLAIASSIVIPAAMGQYLSESVAASLAAAALLYLLLTFFVGPTIAMGQTLVLPHMRATTAAIMLMMYNVFGLGLGPLTVGVLSDVLTQRFGLGTDGLRYAVVTAMCIEALAVTLYIVSGRHLLIDMARDRSRDFSPDEPTAEPAAQPAN